MSVIADLFAAIFFSFAFLLAAILGSFAFFIMISTFWDWLTDKDFRDRDWAGSPGHRTPQNKFTLTLFAVLWIVMILSLGLLVFRSIYSLMEVFW